VKVEYTTDKDGWVRPWTPAEKEEIAHLRKEGRDESYILGWMKTGNKRRGMAPPLKERKMGTVKKTGKKKAAKKKAVKKTTTKKTSARKTKGTPGRKTGGFQVGEKLTAVTGMDDSFYQKFPRYKAYQLICKKKTMATAAFVDAVEKMDGVKSRGQALGILTKLLDKGCVKASGAKKTA